MAGLVLIPELTRSMLLLYFIGTLIIQHHPSEANEVKKCSKMDGYSRDLPENGQAFYMETDKNTGRWHYSTPDQWIQKDYLPKDKLIDAPDNWPRWIFHKCGSRNGYDLVCIESGRYEDYWAYNSGGSLAISYSSSPRGSDWKWTHWYVISKHNDGYIFLCNYDDSPNDPDNCNSGIGPYIYIPPSCAGWEQRTCCSGSSCEYTYTQGITKTEGSSTTVSFGGEYSSTFEAGLTDVISVGGSQELTASLSHTISSSASETKTQQTKIKVKQDHCLWVEFVTYGSYQLNRAYWKQCPGRRLCYD